MIKGFTMIGTPLDLFLGFEPDIHFGSKDDSKKTGNGPENIKGSIGNHDLDVELDYDKVFRIVKRDVRKVLGKERAGLGLALSDLPSTLGAYWQVGGNYIVMNESLINAMTGVAKSVTEFNSYIYVILMHEYLHSLGYIDEMDARRTTAYVVRTVLGTEHHAYAMSAGDIWTIYPMLKYVRGGNGQNLRIVGTFDSSSTSYIG